MIIMKSLLSPLKRIIFLSFISLTIFAGKESGCGCGDDSKSSSSHSSQGSSGRKPFSHVGGILLSSTSSMQKSKDLTNIKKFLIQKGYPAEVLEIKKSSIFLKLSDKQISDLDAIALANALEKNNPLTYLDLSFNQIGDTGATALANALEKNNPLIYLGLSRNEIGDMGATALAN